MAGNTKSIVKDVDAKPAPQYFNPIADAYEYLLGRNGANRVELYGPDGSPISTTGGKLDVRASEVETLLATLGSKDFATQTTLAAVLAKLSADPATQTTLAGILAKTDLTLSALRDALRGVDAKTLSDLATLLAGTVDVQLTGSSLELFGATVAARPAANTVPVGAIYMAVQTQEIWQSDGTDWVVI